MVGAEQQLTDDNNRVENRVIPIPEVNLTRRERFFKAVSHEKTETPPFYFTLCADLMREFARKYGGADFRDFYEIPIREVFLGPTNLDLNERFRDWTGNLPPGCAINEWGMGMQYGGTAHFYRMLGPLAGRLTPENIDALPFPDFDAQYRWEGVAEHIEELKSRDLIVMTGIYGGADSGSGSRDTPAFVDIFESSWYLCGLDELLTAMYCEPEVAELLLERMTVFKEGIAAKWAAAGVDVMVYGDDVATQISLMMSPEMWRSLLKPRLRRVIQAAKDVNPDVLIFYHSDGNIMEIIPDLIEVGVEILNPIQPECMDPVEVAGKFGDRVCFWGTVGTQTTFPNGSPDDVVSVCRKMVDVVGKNGGLILAPTHILEPDVPFENVEAFARFVRPARNITD